MVNSAYWGLQQAGPSTQLPGGEREKKIVETLWLPAQLRKKWAQVDGKILPQRKRLKVIEEMTVTLSDVYICTDKNTEYTYSCSLKHTDTSIHKQINT